MKRNFFLFFKFLPLLFFSFSPIIISEPSNAKESGIQLENCNESLALEKRLNASIKKFENRLKFYEKNTPQFEFLKKEIVLTKARFDNYKNSTLVCGKDGLPHLITTGDLNHFNELGFPALIFLYITGWIGWTGRKYLQYSTSTENPYEKEIIINIPIAFPIIVSGFFWPIEAWKEFVSGQLVLIDDDITISPR